LNNDVHPGLVVTLETGGSRAAVFLNNGDGTFAIKVDYPTGNAPQRIAVADVNNDTFPDIVTSNKSGDGVSVLAGNGDGTFQTKTDYPTGDNPRGLLISDLDGDTDPDLLVAHRGANFHTLLLNDGNGVFTDGDPVFSSSDNENCLLVDVDRDGLRDIVSRVSFGGSQAIVSHGLVGGGFESREQFSFGSAQFSAGNFEVADVNGDDRPDIVAGNKSLDTVDILIAQTGGGFAAITPVSIAEDIQYMTLAQLNPGTAIDLAVVTQRPDFSPGNASNQLHILYGDDTGSFTPESVADLHAHPKEVLAGDFNGDTLIDLLVTFNASGEVQLFINNGSGFTAQTPVSVGDAFSGSYNNKLFEDLNGDELDDLIVAVHVNGPALIKVFLGNPGGTLTESQVIIPLNSDSAQKLAVADVNGDTFPDLLATLAVTSKLVFYPGNSNGSLGTEQLLIDGYAGDIAVADVNTDGLIDILDKTAIRLGREGGGFEDPFTHYIGPTTLPVVAGDINGDGRPDLVAVQSFSGAAGILLHR